MTADCWSVKLLLCWSWARVLNFKSRGLLATALGRLTAFSLMDNDVGQHLWHRSPSFCRKRTLVLDALKILVSIELCYMVWGNSLVAESLQHCCTCFLNFGFCSSAFSNKVFFISQPSLFTPTLIPLNHNSREVLLRPSYGLLPNETGFLHLSYSHIFSLEIDFTNTIVSFSQLSVVINFGAEGLTSFRYVCASHVFVCRSLYCINSTSSAVLIRVASP